ncbi:MAG: hypothetical protein IPM82_20670 [Saprospiraceae bacterium]|nr:hypothetical protein [Saprospiraceae bacterium]
MKLPIITSALLLIGSLLAAQSSATFTQALSVKAGQSLRIELDQPYIVKACKGNAVMVETSITLQNGGNATLHRLNSEGQFQLYLNRDVKGLKLSDNTRRQLAMVNGASLCEKVSYVIYVPEGVQVMTEEKGAVIAVR